MNQAAASRLCVRRAAAADVDALRLLAQAVAALPLLQRYGVQSDRLGDDLAALARLHSEPAGSANCEELWLAEDAADRRSLLGFARVLIGSERGSGHFGRGGYLRLIALRPGENGRGVGSRLLAAVEDSVRMRHSDLFLLTSDFNQAAQRFYERAGYVRVGALPDFVHAGITELIYWKRLLASTTATTAASRPHES